MADSAPQILGLKKSFGYGDRLGIATPGHLAANRKRDFAPVFAQQSLRQLERTGRKAREVIDTAAEAVREGGHNGPWGADADHLKSEDDVDKAATAGFSLFSIDPSEWINDEADTLPEKKVMGEVESLYAEGVFQTLDWDDRFLGEKYMAGENVYRFNRDNLYRAAIKFGRALEYCEKLAGTVAARNGYGNYEIEISLDGSGAPTTPLEHIFLALELRHRGVAFVSLALHFPGGLESGIDYSGDPADFEAALVRHVAIARRYGPYKISVHNGSDKFRIYPALGRVCGDLLHVKTSGTSYLEALRVVFRADPVLFHDILRHSAEHFAEEKEAYSVSTTEDEARTAMADASAGTEESLFTDKAVRQVLHVCYGSVLAGAGDSRGRSFRSALMEILENRRDEYRQTLEAHFDKHLDALCEG